MMLLYRVYSVNTSRSLASFGVMNFARLLERLTDLCGFFGGF